MTDQIAEETDFACPRCARTVRERFYGPCAQCREELCVTQHTSPRDIEVAPYEPKMNVTPNFVATKE